MAQSAETTTDLTQAQRIDPFLALGSLLGRAAARDFFRADTLLHQDPSGVCAHDKAENPPPAPVDNPDNRGTFSGPAAR